MSEIITDGYKFKHGPYKIIKKIGQGGQCNVYLARKGKEDFALKELHATHEDPSIQSGYIKMFKREYELLSILAHPVLPKAYDYFKEDKRNFVVVEFISGENLSEIMKRTGKPLPEEVILEISLKISELLLYLSLREPPVLLRDIKPLNIIITRNGEVKFIDFTIAREYSSDRGDTLRLGSPGYAPPEQYKGKSEGKSDVYALGVTMHEMLTLQDPSSRPLNLSFNFNFPVSDSLCDLIRRATALKPEERYSPEEFHNRVKESYYRRISPDPLYRNISPLKKFSLEIYGEEKKYPSVNKKEMLSKISKDKKAKDLYKKKNKGSNIVNTKNDIFMCKNRNILLYRSIILMILWFLYLIFGMNLLNNPVVFMFSVVLTFFIVIIMMLKYDNVMNRKFTVSQSHLLYSNRQDTIEIPLNNITSFGFQFSDNKYIIEGDGKKIIFNKDIEGWDKLKNLIESRTGLTCMSMENKDIF